MATTVQSEQPRHSLHHSAPSPAGVRVSVIIPALNEADRIVNAIQSAASAGAHDIIVVDGGSHDNTAAIAENHATVTRADRRGRAYQQNLGAASATGDVLLFLHADCQLAPEALKELEGSLRQNPTAVGGCFQQRINASGWRFRALEVGNRWRARLLRRPYGDQAIFVRADVFRSLGGFPDLPFMEDFFFSRKLNKSGKLLFLNSPLEVCARRWQHNGVLRQTIKNWGLVAAATLGTSPARLKKFYPNER